jgi:ATP-dependent Lhr-like helicase
MIARVEKQHTKGEVLDLLEDLVRRWFSSKFTDITEPQGFAVPLIHQGQNVMVSSPTGSGKTLTAFLAIINELYALQRAGRLEERIYCVYVSPLKALANDIRKNLLQPLEEMSAMAQSEGLEPPAIRVGLRSGDTSSSERQSQARRPPHIFITTPESLALVITTPVFKERFRGVQWVIVDEIHEICSNKRGAHLSLTLERLREHVASEFVRIGLSATIAPMEEVALFLSGYDDDGRPRPMNVVEVESRKRLDMRVLCPVKDMTAVPYEVVNARMYDLLKGMIADHRTTLVFTNTRSGTEHVSYKLKERGVEDLEAHHGSLSKEVRLDVEDRLKKGELRAVICSTSLELGIDIGYIDLVCQIGSPKSIAKALQRIGRAGHAVGQTSVGRLVVFENDDLVECAALVKNAYDNRIDQVDIPRNCLDVLAQSVVGMSLERKWSIQEAFRVVRRSYSFHGLPEEDFNAVLRYLSSRNPDVSVYAKIWLDEGEGVFGRKKGSRMIYFTNIGTIPEEGTYHVYNNRGAHIGELSEKFVEYLSQGDIFVLGGRTYQFERLRGTTVFVKDASGRRPTVPSWTGEMLPRSFDLSRQVGVLRREILAKVDAEGEGAAKAWLMEVGRVDRGSAESMVNYVLEQRAIIPHVPTDRTLLVEGYVDAKGNRNAIFHFPFGRRTNDALARAYAFALSNKLGCNVRVSITDDNFMLTVPKRFSLDGVEALITADRVEELLRKAVRTTELFKQRFRHCATRSFMILRNYRGHEVSVGRQQLRSQKVLDWLHELENFPVIKEAYNEILNEVMDLKHAREVLTRLAAGELQIRTSDFSNVPSPFAHNVVLAGISDIVLMEDRSALLRELHRQVLKRVVPTSELAAVQFHPGRVQEYFRRKLPPVASKADLLLLLERAGAVNLLQQKGVSALDNARVPLETVRQWAGELMQEGRVESVWTPRGVLWALTEDVPSYAAVYARRARLRDVDSRAMGAMEAGPKTSRQLQSSLRSPKQALADALHRLERAYLLQRTGVEEVRWRPRRVEPQGFDAALAKLITRLLGVRGPLTLAELTMELDLPEDQVKEALRVMEGNNLVASGHFLVDADYQYLLSRDLRALEGPGEEGPSVEEPQVREYLLRKHFGTVGSIQGYFDLFLEAGTVYDVAQRVPGFRWSDWLEKRRSGDILEGRFLNGRVRYVRARDGPLFASAYEREAPTELEARVLDLVRRSEGIDTWSIAQALEEEYEVVKEAVDRLDRNLHIVRKFTGDDAWTSRNYYVAYDPGPRVPRAAAELVIRFLRANGPISFGGVKGHLGLDWDVLEEILGSLVGSGRLVKVRVGGEGEERYLLAEELPILQATKGDGARDRLRVLSLLDPWVQPLWAEITARYGEGWFYPLVKDGTLVGMVEKWEMSGCVEVRDLDLSDPSLLGEVPEALERMMDYYGQRGFEVVRITRLLGQDVPEASPKVLRPFTKAGYHRLTSFLAKGRIVPQEFPRREVMARVFRKQGLHPRHRFKDGLEAVTVLGGLRSDFEAALRVESARPLERLHRRGFLSKGLLIPEYVTYTTEEDLMLFKAAKSVPLDAGMDAVLRTIRASEPVSRSRILALSPLGRTEAAEALKRLYRGLHVTRDEGGAYRTVKDVRVPVPEARKRVLRRIIENFGVFTAENLASFTRFEYNMAETRRILRELEDEGFLVKGFLAAGESSLYWAVKRELKRIPGSEFHRSFVLSPTDGLHLYLRSEIQARWGMGSCYVIFNGTEMVAAFKANKRKGNLTVTEYVGDPEGREVLRRWALENDLRVREGPGGAELEEWEVEEWWEKMYASAGAGRSRKDR